MSGVGCMTKRSINLDLYNTWNLSEADQDKLEEYWRRIEEHVKPQASHLLNLNSEI